MNTRTVEPQWRGALLLIAIVTGISTLLVLSSFPQQARAAGCVVPNRLGVTFVIDDSGSMSTTDPDYLRSDAVRIALDQLPDGTIASAGSFDTYSRTIFDPVALDAANRMDLSDQVLDTLSSSGNTDYGEAFSLADQLLDSTAGADKRAVIFLSDGDPTDGEFANESMTNSGVPIYTVGFGTISNSTLERIADFSGGRSFDVETSAEAQSAFAEIVGDLNCDTATIGESFDLNPGETRSFDFNVEFLDQFNALASWDYGDVQMKLRRPDGSFLADGSTIAGEAFRTDSNSASARSSSPAVGGWQVQLTADSGNVDATRLSIDVFNRPTPKDLPVILISGLNSNAGYVTPGPNGTTTTCGAGGDLATLCSAIAQKRYPVFVVPQRPNPPNKQDLDSTQPIDINARRLVRFIKSNPSGRLFGHARPVFVGHSAGGLIARKAISQYGVQASGLYTIGSPHNGSFAADALETTVAGCFVGGFVGAAVCASGATYSSKTPLVSDLTRVARKSDRMNHTKVPTWLYAGTPIGKKPYVSEYFAPNDLAVGKSSALAHDANIGSATKIIGGAWHTYQWGVNSPGDEFQLTSPWVATFVNKALGGLVAKGGLRVGSGVSSHSMRSSSRAGSSLARTAKKKKSKGSKKLKSTKTKLEFTAAARKAKAGRTKVRDQSVIASAPFTLACASGNSPSILIAPSVYQATAIGKCTLIGFKSSGAVTMPRKQPRGIRATATFDRNKHTVTLIVRGVRSAKLRLGKHKTKKLKRSGKTFRVKLTKHEYRNGPVILEVRSRAGNAAAPVPAPR